MTRLIVFLAIVAVLVGAGAVFVHAMSKGLHQTEQRLQQAMAQTEQ